MATLDALKQDRTDLKADLKKYKKRLSEVKQVRTDLNSVSEDYCEEINKKLNKALEKLGDGLVTDRVEFWDTISAMKQKGIDSDSNLSECKQNLDQEVSRIDQKIQTANKDLSDVEDQIEAGQAD